VSAVGFFKQELCEINERVIRYWIADLQICNTRVAISDYQIQGVTGDVRWLVDMLDVPERLQQLHQ